MAWAVPVQAQKAGRWQKETVAVPLDPVHPRGQRLRLDVVRWSAPRPLAKREAVVALAGGPGQSATPLAAVLANLIGSQVANRRDIVIFDQRGTGKRALVCRAAETELVYQLTADIARACADEIGPRRKFFSTQESVADIEALRRRYGYRRLVLYGTSYGTKVALDYARSYPQRTARLLLDSLVGPDQSSLTATMRATPRIFELACKTWDCSRATNNARGDVVAANQRLASGATATVYDGSGRPQAVPLHPETLMLLSLAADMSPPLRASVVTLAGSVARGDLASMALVEQQLFAQTQDAGSARKSMSYGLYAATTCMDSPPLWSGESSFEQRLAATEAFWGQIKDDDLAGMPAAFLRSLSPLPACAAWPEAPTPAPKIRKLKIPALVLEGSWDSRTPTEGVAAVLEALPKGRLVVADSGHSVMGGDTCALANGRNFMRGRKLRRCSATHPDRRIKAPSPDPLAITETAAVPGYETLIGQGIRSAIMTSEMGIAYLIATSSTRAGGYRGGWVEARETNTPSSYQVVFHDYSYIPGLAISGTLEGKVGAMEGTLTVTGTLGGDLRLTQTGELGGAVVVSGTLNGVVVNSRVGSVARRNNRAIITNLLVLAKRARRLLRQADTGRR